MDDVKSFASTSQQTIAKLLFLFTIITFISLSVHFASFPFNAKTLLS